MLASNKNNISMPMKYLSKHFLLSLCTLCISMPALAEIKPFNEDFNISLGAFRPTVDTNIQLDSLSNTGDSINLEDDLKFDSEVVVFRMDGAWRFSSNHKLGFDFYQINRNVTTTLAADITLGDNTYSAGSNVKTELNVSIVDLNYQYMFLHEPRYEAGIILGIHLALADFSFAPEVYTSDGNTSVIYKSETTYDITGPYPALGFMGGYAFTDKWLVTSQIKMFFFDFEDLGGNLLDINIGTEYYFIDEVGLGLGYAYSDIGLNANTDALVGDIKLTYHGFRAYLKIRL